jgi:hypothetical protein
MKEKLAVIGLLLLFFLGGCDLQEEIIYTLDDLREASSGESIGVSFWDEFNDYKTQYSLTPDESMLLGEWYGIGIQDVFNSYSFFPNKFFILYFNYENYKVQNTDETYFGKALGTWEIDNNTVTIKIYTIITRNHLIRDRIAGRDLFFVEPYEIDVININDVDPIGYTRRPINADILSRELQKMVEIKEPNRTKNLFMRSIYSMDYVTSSGKPEKNYDYFNIVPELAKENIPGLDLATDPDLIRKFIFPLWF